MNLTYFLWIALSVLGGISVCFLFVQGGATAVRTLTRDEAVRQRLSREFSALWLWPVVSFAAFAGLLCVAFPAYFRVGVCGAWGLWTLLVLGYFFSMLGSWADCSGKSRWIQSAGRSMRMLGGIMTPLLLGVWMGTFFSGGAYLAGTAEAADGMQTVVKTIWLGEAHGLEAFFSIDNLMLGAAMLYLARILSMLFVLREDPGMEIVQRIRSLLLTEMVIFLVFFLAFIVRLCMRVGLTVDEASGMFQPMVGKFLQNIVEQPLVLVFMPGGLVLILTGIFRTIFFRALQEGFFLVGGGMVLIFGMLLLVAGGDHSSFFPSTLEWQHSLTLTMASASDGLVAAALLGGILLIAFFLYKFRKIGGRA